jgi:hypothetical protein
MQKEKFMPTKLNEIIKEQADNLDNLTGADKAMAIFAFAEYLLGRGVVVMSDVQSRAGLDDQGLLDLAKRHDDEAAAAWKALQAANGQ